MYRIGARSSDASDVGRVSNMHDKSGCKSTCLLIHLYHAFGPAKEDRYSRLTLQIRPSSLDVPGDSITLLLLVTDRLPASCPVKKLNA